MIPSRLRVFLFLSLSSLAACGGSGSAAPAGDAAPAVDAPAPLTPEQFMATLKGDSSCVLSCQTTCAEANAPWQCPALADWSTLPHASPACGAFDGTTFPAPVAGKCVATVPSGDALAKTSNVGPPVILPDGRRLVPDGTEWVFDPIDAPGGFPAGSYLVPGTKWLLVVDTGYDVQTVRVIDTTILRTHPGTSPVVDELKFPPPSALNWGIAYAAGASVLYVPSGIPDSKVFAFDFDAATGQLTEDAAKTITLGAGVFPQAVAVSPDGKTLLVGPITGGDTNPTLGVLVYSLAAASYGTLENTIGLGTTDVFGVQFDPNDATGNTAYATLWHSDVVSGDSTTMVLSQLDVSAGKSTAIAVGKEPEGMAFLDGRYMVVANGFSDSLTLVDRPAGMVASTVQLLSSPSSATTHGVEPTLLAYDPVHARLYATLASANGVEAFDVELGQTPPVLTPAGTFSTAWWPTSLSLDPDGTLYVTNGRGHGTALKTAESEDDGELTHGSVQAVPYMTSGVLAEATASWTANTVVSAMSGYPSVECNGAPYDFPVPQTTTSGPSAQIQHIVFVVRENKTFDALFGDLPGVDGDPTRVLAPGMQDEIWPNARTVAPTFAHMDNFYEDAEQSIQGHFWTTYGRTSDLDERRWVVEWGRGEITEAQTPGLFDDTAPLEGSVFGFLAGQGVGVVNMGELLDGFRLGPYSDKQWPGGSSNTTIPDSIGACYATARARVLCDLPQFTYAWLANDHTFGLSAGYPNPSLMIAENDEATGMLLDGLSHSPMWPTTLYIVVEDDPQDGSDHVDQHRTIALFASPWVKRGYVSHAHYDLASIHKLFDHVFGTPYPSQVVADAPLPLDIFTSTPDYTPYEYKPRVWTDLSCNPKTGKGAEKAQRWDFTKPDDQPGLSEQIEEALRGRALAGAQGHR